MSFGLFDDRNVSWQTLDGIEHAAYYVLDVDVEAKVVDVLFRFAANEQVVMHRHHADYRTFVVQGELKIYRPDGSLKEVRPAGSYIFSPAGGEPHTEGGGDVDAIVFFSNRGTDGVIYEILDPNMNTLATLGLHDFKVLFDAQFTAPDAAVVRM